MNSRQRNILHTVIREYIQSGSAVGSKLICEKYDMGISPALIRSELHDLMDQGYLDQPYTSSGRVPTDKGYRSFVDSLMLDGIDSIDKLASRFEKRLDKVTAAPLQDMISAFSECTEGGGVGFVFHPPSIYKRGLNLLVGNISFTNKDEVVSVVDDFEKLDDMHEKLYTVLSDSRGGPAVYIGKESPITKSNKLSLIMEMYSVSDGREIAILLIGPRRMNYGRNLALMKAIRGAIE